MVTFNNFLKINNIEMYSTYNEGKSVVAERFKDLKHPSKKKILFLPQNIYNKKFATLLQKHFTAKYLL